MVPTWLHCTGDWNASILISRCPRWFAFMQCKLQVATEEISKIQCLGTLFVLTISEHISTHCIAAFLISWYAPSACVSMKVTDILTLVRRQCISSHHDDLTVIMVFWEQYYAIQISCFSHWIKYVVERCGGRQPVGFVVIDGFVPTATTPSQIPKTLGPMLIRHRSDAFVSDRCLIDVDPRGFVIWVMTQDTRMHSITEHQPDVIRMFRRFLLRTILFKSLSRTTTKKPAIICISGLLYWKTTDDYRWIPCYTWVLRINSQWCGRSARVMMLSNWCRPSSGPFWVFAGNTCHVGDIIVTHCHDDIGYPLRILSRVLLNGCKLIHNYDPYRSGHETVAALLPGFAINW